MNNYRERYVELHGLEFDIEHSDCRDCEHAKKQSCQYYYGECPQGMKASKSKR